MAWNRPENGEAVSRPLQKRSEDRFPVRGAVAGVIVVVGAAIAAWWILSGNGRGEDAASTAKRSLINEVKPALSSSATNKTEGIAAERDPHAGMRLSSTGVWQPADRPYRAGATKVHPVVTNAMRRSVAHGAVDQVLLGIFSRSLGDMPMPLPERLPKREVDRMAEILLDRHPDRADDSETDKFNKETLRQAKQAAREFIKNGGTIEDFIRSYHKELSRCYTVRTESQRFVSRALRDGEDPAVVSEMVKSINAKLKAQGIRQIRDPAHNISKKGE